MNNDKQFTITLNERQLKLLAYACRVTNRLIIGQLNFSLQECCESAFEKLHKNDGKGDIGRGEWYCMRFEVGKMILRVRKLCWGLEPFKDYGIHYDSTADILFDMQQVMGDALLREQDAENRPNWFSEAITHTNPVGEEKNIKVNVLTKVNKKMNF